MRSEVFEQMSQALADAKKRWKARVLDLSTNFRQVKDAVKDRRQSEGRRIGYCSVDLTVEHYEPDGITFHFDRIIVSRKGHRRYPHRKAIERSIPRPKVLSVEADRPYLRSDFVPHNFAPWVINHCLHYDDTVLAPLRRIRRAITLAERLLAKLSVGDGDLAEVSLKLAVLNVTRSVRSLEFSGLPNATPSLIRVSQSPSPKIPQLFKGDRWDFITVSSLMVITLFSYRALLEQMPGVYHKLASTVRDLLDPVRAHGFFGPRTGLLVEPNSNGQPRLNFYHATTVSQFDPESPPSRRTRLTFGGCKNVPPEKMGYEARFDYWWRGRATHIQRDAALYPIEPWERAHFPYAEKNLVAPIRHRCAMAEQLISLIPEIANVDKVIYTPLPIHYLALENQKHYRAGEQDAWN